MKKILAIVLAMALVLGLAACGSAPAPAPAPSAPAAPEQSSPAPAPEADSEGEGEDDYGDPFEELDVWYVDSLEALVEALADDRIIYLAPGTYNMTDYLNTLNYMPLPWDSTPYRGLDYYDEYDGRSPVISGYKNLSIIAEDPEQLTEIVCTPRYATVLKFFNCDNLLISGITFGHLSGFGECSAPVLELEHCLFPYIYDCDLYGCGTNGINLYECRDAAVSNCYIHDCSNVLVDINDCYNIGIYNCTLTNADPGYCVGFFVNDGENVNVSGCEINNLSELIYVDGFSRVDFTGNNLDEAASESLVYSPAFGEYVFSD